MTEILPSLQNNAIVKRKGFALVVGVYLVAGLLSILVARQAGGPLWRAVLAGSVVGTLLVFVGSFAVRNSSMYDPYWSAAPAFVAVVLFATQPGLSSRRTLITLVTLVWAIRLTANWAYGWAGLHHEDWRYRKLQTDTGKAYWLVSLLGVHFFPTVLTYLGMLPFFTSYVSRRSLNIWDLFGVVIALGMTALEGVADIQMHRHRRVHPDGGTVLDSGLWGWSRHPNYVGEIGFWVGIACFGIAATPAQWWRVGGAVAMLGLFIGISIPMIEKRHHERKGVAFAEYCKRVPMMLGLPRK